MQRNRAKNKIKKTDKKRKLINLSLIVFSISIVFFTVIGALIIDNFSYLQQVEELSELEDTQDNYKGEIDDRLRFIAMQEEELVALNTKNNQEQDVTSDEKQELFEPEPIELFLENEEPQKTKFTEYNERYRKKDVNAVINADIEERELHNLQLRNEIPAVSPLNMKVVIGDFSTKEAALHELAAISSQFSAPPFVKVVNGAYVIQVASFKTPETAYEFVNSLRQQGFSARIIEE